jgi:hypothetical protein
MLNLLSTYLDKKNTYGFTHAWEVPAPAETIWKTLTDYQAWPGWWEGLSTIESLTPQSPLGKGSRIRSTWKGTLPYSICFDAEITSFYPYFYLEFQVTGDLVGNGCCKFSSCTRGTRIQLTWQVVPTIFWIRMSAPFARSIFQENHDQIMHQAEQGMKTLFPG